MLVEAARRAESAAREVLALAGDGSASCAEMREALPLLKSASAAIFATQTAAARSVGVRERHGDGGAEMLAEAAGLSRNEARGQVKTATTIRKVPVLREAVESGRVPRANAARLAAAVEQVGAAEVQSDHELLQAAESMRPEQFAKEARRWSADRRDDDGAGEHARQRARRRLRVWDGDDGMVHLHGEFDKVAGTRIANRLRRQARGLLDADKKAPDTGARRRSFDQCMADALDNITGRGPTGGRPGTTTDGTGGRPGTTTDGTGGMPDTTTDGTGGRPDTTTDGTGGRPDTTTDGTGGRPDTTTDGTGGRPDTTTDGTGGRPDTTTDGTGGRPDTTTDGTGGRPDTTTDGTGGRPDTTTDGTGGRPDTTTDGTGGRPDTTTDGTGGRPDTTTDGTGGRPDTTTDGTGGRPDTTTDGTGGRPDTTGDTASRIEGRPFADICVMVRTDDDTGRLIAELPDRTRLPRPVLDALSCDATISGVICDRQGSPIWRSYASRGATDAQKQILFATYGGCFNCGANPGLCQIHHIEPVWLGGRTEINNLVPLCYRCHDRIHHHGWWILKRTLGHHTMHPPDHARHGPAHESDHPVLYRIAPPANHSPDDPRPADAAAGPNRHRRGPPHTVGPPLDSDLPLGDRRREPALF